VVDLLAALPFDLLYASDLYTGGEVGITVSIVPVPFSAIGTTKGYRPVL